MEKGHWWNMEYKKYNMNATISKVGMSNLKCSLLLVFLAFNENVNIL